ncbi:unnamed protein product [Rotaria sordida]|uniref:Isopenicillin N synthase-like Fe(2+) 2OG dioxygenase domain-containing protein n=1 Tax=Rotaria sordida TaxID=392033 RepID=A0A813XBW1_9BILA|nr:unnamed protein product [Rotaria sordida]CAF3776284.1 unnamed protein product [Rotaria sordida]
MSSKQSFNNHTLVNFDKLLLGDSSEINHLQNEFESHGWCFIRLPNKHGELTNKLNEIQTILSAFFARSQYEKSQYESFNAFGYSHVGHKEGIKVLIDQNGLKNFHHRLSNDVEQALQYLAISIYNLTNVLKNVMFKMPVFTQNPNDNMVELSPFGMLDIVNYFNKKPAPKKQPKVGLNTDEVNCVPHFDPGLFSLSILSTCEGLQLHDQLQDKWIDGPNNSELDQHSIGVIWLGEAASILTKNRFKSGIHRVVYPDVIHKSRLTIWQEICTKAQIDPLISKKDNSIFIPNNTNIRMINQPNSVPLRIRSGGENLNNFMRRVENDRGLSISKVAPHHFKMISNSNDNNDDSDDDNDDQYTQQQKNTNFLPGGASVTMKNQPNSLPFQIQSGGETMNNFIRRVENERGLSITSTIDKIVNGVTHTRFVGTISNNDEVVLMRILQVLHSLLLSPIGSQTTNNSLRDENAQLKIQLQVQKDVNNAIGPSAISTSIALSTTTTIAVPQPGAAPQSAIVPQPAAGRVSFQNIVHKVILQNRHDDCDDNQGDNRGRFSSY